MLDTQKLTAFLYDAHLPHALGTSNATRQADHSTTITYENGDWSFHDNFFGGSPYGGREVVFYKGKPVWITVYYGAVEETELSAKEVYDFLRLALQYAPKDKPMRGPANFVRGELTYRCRLRWTIQNYVCKETILQNGKQMYRATYIGGLVDQQAGAVF